MKYVIWAGGEGRRFVSEGVRCKHQIKVDSETLLERVVRQIRPTANEIWIMGCAADHLVPTTGLYVTSELEKRSHRFWKWLKGFDLVGESDMTFLYGDVFYTDAAISAITQSKNPLQFLMRPGPSLLTGKSYKEIFAIRVEAVAQHEVKNLIEKAFETEKVPWRRHIQKLTTFFSSQNESSATYTGGFWILRELAGIKWYHSLFVWKKFKGDRYMDPFFQRADRYVTVIDDWTEDFDTWDEFVEWSSRRMMADPD
jgi:hypothetical protein